ncbi:unnamed protein product, partial [Mesorhabditis belari]|uniref:Uncharacterized protein n=1 Tax=Mesorhabditis belari TaxID=2138241 RepID=A0AAF3J482_9BILA
MLFVLNGCELKRREKALFMGNKQVFSQQDSFAEENIFDESFTIYLGAQLKTMHNVRLLSRKTPLNGPLGGSISQRLQSAMNLYRRGGLHGTIILVEKHPMWHTQERTDLARACEKSTELHFETLGKQLEQVQNSIQGANQWRCEQSLQKVTAGQSLQTPFDAEKQREECSLLVGDLYTTRHSNLDGVQIIFHLVIDNALRSGDITSRHPCLAGIRNVIRACSRFGVTSISIPLLLVEEANENMTVQWCVKRAELVFKCVKGYLMEVCGSGWESSAPGGPALSHSPHYNINFVLPSGLGASGMLDEVEAPATTSIEQTEPLQDL